jgi:putative ABC transport system permease protein
MKMILRQSATVALGGIGAGLMTALAGGSLIQSLLYNVSPRDPVVFGGTTLALFTIALVACWLPARRAANVDPLIALRAD